MISSFAFELSWARMRFYFVLRRHLVMLPACLFSLFLFRWAWPRGGPNREKKRDRGVSIDLLFPLSCFFFFSAVCRQGEDKRARVSRIACPKKMRPVNALFVQHVRNVCPRNSNKRAAKNGLLCFWGNVYLRRVEPENIRR